MQKQKVQPTIQASQPMRNYYEILDVNPNATLRQIENSYQKLALKWHPDKHTADRKLAERRFQQISEAFDVLSDANKRSTYDQLFNKQSSLQNSYKIFDQFFGQNEMINEQEERFFQKNFPERRKNYYKILGVNRDATLQQITQAYRKLALKYHPRNTQNNEQAKRKFIQVNEAYQTLSNRLRRSTYDDVLFNELVPRRAHDIFQDFFQNRWMDIPTETDFFRPIFDRRNRMVNRLGNWPRLQVDERRTGKQLQNIKQGQSLYKQERYEKKNGKENHTSQTIRKKINNGIVEQEILKQNILPNGERDVVKTIKKGDKVDTKSYHLKRDEKLPRELTNY